MPLVLLRQAQQVEQRVLRSFFREEEVVPAIDHKHRHLYVRREIEGINLGKGWLVFETTAHPNGGLDSRLHCSKDGPKRASPADAIVGDASGIEIVSRLYVIESASDVFVPVEDMLAVGIGAVLVVAVQTIAALERAFVNGTK